MRQRWQLISSSPGEQQQGKFVDRGVGEKALNKQETRLNQHADAATALAAASAAVAEGQGGGGDLLLFVASKMTRVLRRWKRTQVSKLLDNDGQRHQSRHLIYKQ